jgi:hypothetical protein
MVITRVWAMPLATPQCTRLKNIAATPLPHADLIFDDAIILLKSPLTIRTTLPRMRSGDQLLHALFGGQCEPLVTDQQHRQYKPARGVT